MALQKTKVPALYQIPASLDPELKRHLESISEALNIRLGRRGDPLDRAVTLRELIDGGIAKEYRSSGFDPNIGSDSNPGFVNYLETEQTNFDLPPQPTNLVAAAAFTSITLTWDNPGMSNLAYTEIARATTDSLDFAVTQDRTRSFVWTDAVGYGETYYYWVRFVSTSNIEGPWSVSATGTTEDDIAAIMAALSEDLSNLPGYTTLNTNLTADIATAKAEAIAGGSYIIRATSAPTVRDTSPTTPLQPFDVWFDTDDDNQPYIRNSANDAWVEARDGTLVALVDAQAVTISGHTTSIATANTNIATVTTANSALSTTVTNLSATVDTKAQTFAQDGAPADNSTNALLAGDLWIATNDSNKLYRWDGDSWEEMIDPSTSGINVYAQDAAPTSALIAGDLWFDTDDGNKQYRYNGSAWVAVDDTRITTTSNALTSLTATVTGTGGHASQLTSLNSSIVVKTQTFAQAGIPTSIATGDIWIDTDDSNKIYRAASVGADAITAGEWILLRDSGIGTALTNAASAISDASDAQSTADEKVVTFFQDGIPGTGVETGDLWIDTNDGNKLYRAAADGADEIAAGEWIQIQDTAIAQAISDAGDAQSTADGKIVTFLQAGIPGTDVGIGDLWIDTDDANKLYRAAANGANEIAAGEWVEVTADSMKTFSQAGVPTSITAGDIWIDTDDGNKLYRANAAGVSAIVTTGNGWYALPDGRITTNASAVSDLSTAVGLSGAEATKITALETTVNDGTSGVAATAGAVSTLTATVNTQAKTFAQDAAPTDSSISGQPLKDGDIWVDTDDNNKMYRWNNSTNQWIPLGQRTVFSQNSVPGTGVLAGDLWIDTNDDNRFYKAAADDSDAITSGEWEVFADITTAAGSFDSISSSVTTAGNAAAAAQSTANSKIKVFNQGRTTDGVPTAITIGDIWCDTDSETTIVTGGTFNGSSGSIIDVSAETITLTTSQYNSLTANQGVTYSNGGGGSVAGLTNSATYFVIKATTPKIKLASSPGRAINDDPVNLTGVGSGSSHSIGTSVTEANIVHIANATGTGGWVRRDNSTIQSSASSVNTLQQTSDSLTGQSSASHVLQVNSNGHIAGMAISAETSPSGQTTSDVIFQADRFYITSSNASSTNVAPFIVDGTASPPVVYIDTAKIKDAAITAAKVGSLNADVITTGKMIAGIVDADKITAGLMEADRIYVDGESIDTESQGSPAHTVIKIKALGVDTLYIANQAVTFPTFGYTEAAFATSVDPSTGDSAWTEAQTLTLNPTGAPIEILASVNFFWTGMNNPARAYVRIKRGSTVLFTSGVNWLSTGYGVTATVAISDTPSSGSGVIYTAEIMYNIGWATAGTYRCQNRFMRTLELKDNRP